MYNSIHSIETIFLITMLYFIEGLFDKYLNIEECILHMMMQPIPDRSLCERMKAEAERLKLLGDSNSTELHSAQCRQDGTFKPLQCSEVVNTCWCVDQEGVELANTRVDIDDYTPLPQCRKCTLKTDDVLL